jgi:hypothetical protein
MKCWNSAFNAEGSKLVTVAVQVVAVEIYVTAEEALRKKERQDETLLTTKIDGFLSFIPCWMLMYFFLQVFKKSDPIYGQTQGSGAVFRLLYG